MYSLLGVWDIKPGKSLTFSFYGSIINSTIMDCLDWFEVGDS